MNKKILFTSLFLLIATVSFVFKDEIATAATPYFVRAGATATATSSLSYMTAGTATSTYYVDTYKFNGVGDTSGDMDLKLAIQFSASSTQSTLKWRAEYSNGSNCQSNPGNCDWYAESINTAADTATTSIEVRDHKEYSWLFASSTPGGITAPKDRGLKIVTVPIHAQYVRIVFYLPPGSLNGAVWSEALGVQPR